MGCERQGEFRRLYGSRRAATIHVGKPESAPCRALGLGVREISVAAGTGADVMAGGAGAAGPTPDPGYPDLKQYNKGYPRLSRDIQVIPT